MQWKTGWRRRNPFFADVPPEMPFFVNFQDGILSSQGWYEGKASQAAFLGNANPGFWIGGAVMLPFNYVSPGVNRGLMGRVDFNAQTRAGWVIGLGAANQIIMQYQTVAGLVTAGDVTPLVLDQIYVFLIDLFEFTQAGQPGCQVVLYTPDAAGVAQVIDTQLSGPNGNYIPPPLNGVLYYFGRGDPSVLPVGAGPVRLAGMTMANSVAQTGVGAPFATAFFAQLKADLGVPLVGTTPNRIAASTTFPVAPDPYVTDLGINLTKVGDFLPIQDIAYDPHFAY